MRSIPYHPAPPGLRLFVAIRVPEEVKARLLEAQTRLRRAAGEARIAWTRPEQFHLTLRFLGDVEASRVEALKQALVAVATGFAPLDLAARGIGFFPHARAPRVIWTGLQTATDSLVRLQQAVEAACGPFTHEPASQEFTGHITLGRVKGARHSELEPLGQAARELAEVPFGTWTAGQFDLMRSELLPSGARHATLAELLLG